MSFANLTLDDVVAAIRLFDEDHAKALHRRYLDYWLVDGEIELHEAEPAKARKAEKAAPAQTDAGPSNEPAQRPKRRVTGPKPNQAASA